METILIQLVIVIIGASLDRIAIYFLKSKFFKYTYK